MCPVLHHHAVQPPSPLRSPSEPLPFTPSTPRQAVQLLLADSDSHQFVGVAVLGQLRGGSVVQLV
eukprot:2232248-Prymnesium_polylepis.1